MCNHEYEGRVDGIVCKKCGLKLTHEEYAALYALTSPKPKKPKSQKRRPKNE